MLYATVGTRSEAAQHPPGPMTLDPMPLKAREVKSEGPRGAAALSLSYEPRGHRSRLKTDDGHGFRQQPYSFVHSSVFPRCLSLLGLGSERLHYLMGRAVAPELHSPDAMKFKASGIARRELACDASGTGGMVLAMIGSVMAIARSPSITLRSNPFVFDWPLGIQTWTDASNARRRRGQ